MLQSWTSFIVGSRDKPSSSLRRQVALRYLSILELFQLLCHDMKLPRGVLLIEYRWERKRRLVQTNQMATIVSLRDLIDNASVYASDMFVNSDMVFVPYGGKKHPRTKNRKKLLDWAVASALPWVAQLDNQYAWFSGFSSKQERQLFTRFLRQSVVRLSSDEMRIPWRDWIAVRNGLYAHGWTMNRTECSFSKGTTCFHLWGGTNDPLIKPLALPEDVNRHLILRFDSTGQCNVRIVKIRCRLEQPELAGDSSCSGP